MLRSAKLPRFLKKRGHPHPICETMGNINVTMTKRKLRWYQFSLRTLLVVTTLFAVLCSVFAVVRQHVRKKREAVEAIVKLNGRVTYDYEEDTSNFPDPPYPPASEGLIKTFGIDFFANATQVSLYGPKVGDRDLEWLREMTQLNHLYIDSGNVTDDGIKNISGLTRLKILWIGGTAITDRGLNYFGGLSELQQLDLSQTGVTGIGLKHFEGLPIGDLSLENPIQ